MDVDSNIPARPPNLLELDDVAKHFGGVRAVDGCSFSVRKGSITGLIGPNGAGKSTLFDLVSGVLHPDRGEISFEWKRIDGLAPDRVARGGLGRTFQSARLAYRLTVWENLMLAGADARDETMLRALLRPREYREAERARGGRAHELLDFLGLSRLLDEPAASLSGGQRKLLALGRVMMSRPRLILLDEPAAGVNETLTRTLMDRIVELNAGGVTFLIVEHDMDLIMSICHKVVVMHQGRVLATGTADQVQKDRNVVEAYLGGMA